MRILVRLRDHTGDLPEEAMEMESAHLRYRREVVERQALLSGFDYFANLADDRRLPIRESDDLIGLASLARSKPLAPCFLH